jgi:ribosomal protein S18 acetylase RimI-like enzyme
MQSLLGAMRDDGARVVVAELPADEVIGDALTLLRANGFRQTGRIADYYRDGVALLFLRREL